MTNDFHFSFTRNWWAYGDPGGVPNVAGFPAALEIGGETAGYLTSLITPTTRTSARVTGTAMTPCTATTLPGSRGNHLFQIGGLYQRNNDTHNRNDNGESINTYEQYIGRSRQRSSLAGYGIDMSRLHPC